MVILEFLTKTSKMFEVKVKFIIAKNNKNAPEF